MTDEELEALFDQQVQLIKLAHQQDQGAFHEDITEAAAKAILAGVGLNVDWFAPPDLMVKYYPHMDYQLYELVATCTTTREQVGKLAIKQAAKFGAEFNIDLNELQFDHPESCSHGTTHFMKCHGVAMEIYLAWRMLYDVFFAMDFTSAEVLTA